MPEKTEYETGARKFPPKREADASDAFSQDAASNDPPDGIGNSEPLDDVDEKTRHSDGRNPHARRPTGR